MNRLFYLAAPVAIIASATQAGETVRFADTPAWVEPVDLGKAMEMGEEIVLYDRQIRLENGVVTRYTDIAYEVRNTTALQQLGTQQFGWSPDKGDLTIHRMELLRDGKVIDLVAQGLKPEILRRERELEKRAVNGALTAAFAIPGMQVGDVLRLTSSTSVRDQALNNQMQAAEGLVAEPTKLGFGRLRVSWPQGSDIYWGKLGDITMPTVQTSGRDSFVEIALPIAKPAEMPEDAPKRFQVNPTLQFGSFASWADVGATLAPHFGTEGTIQPGGPIAAQVARIMAASVDPATRAAMALTLVQDEISYLANGMDGGNYLPQSPAQTWELKFGDCKAKSLLLLAMLRQMGIESQAVLVDSTWGDAVPISQPIPGAFDHMIVHAKIDGIDYWLDGTGEGARLDSMYEVPNFLWALPVVAEGAAPVPLKQRWPKVADEQVAMTLDISRGVDLPLLYTVTITSRGSVGAQMRPLATQTDPEEVLGAANKKLQNVIEGVVYEADFDYDKATGTATLRAKGMVFDHFEIDRGKAILAIDSATTRWTFKPDRARSAWRDIPYMVGGPYTHGREVTIKLPEAGKGARIEGTAELDEVAAGTKFFRRASLKGDTLTLNDRISYVPRELSTDEIATGKTAIRRIASGDPKLIVGNPRRLWELSDAEIARNVAPVLAGVDKLAETFDGRAEMINLRGFIHLFARNYAAAEAEFETALEMEASVDGYSALSAVQAVLGKKDQALANAERAFELQGDTETAEEFAELLARFDRADEGLDLLDSLGLTGDDAVALMAKWSALAGYAGREEEAWERLGAMIDDRPDNVSLLNGKCWMAGAWNYKVENALDFCDRAVSLSGQEAWVIDSRALVKYRQGRIEEALADYETVLSKEPGTASSLYMRGLIRLDKGDRRGNSDVEQARRIDPRLVAQFSEYGLTPGT
jgi:tetratricopeptide (TPR) repeat protein